MGIEFLRGGEGKNFFLLNNILIVSLKDNIF